MMMMGSLARPATMDGAAETCAVRACTHTSTRARTRVGVGSRTWCTPLMGFNILVNLGASLPLGARGAPAFTLGVGGKAEKSGLQDGTTP